MKPKFIPSRCGQRAVRPNLSLRNQVLRWIADCRANAQAELDSFRRQPSFAAAIETAALAIDSHRNKRFSHQYRITRDALQQAKVILLRAKSKLRSCTSFNELHTLLCQLLTGVRGVGPLYCYDTALRIGAYLKLRPKKVYLHAGTLKEARSLLPHLDRSSGTLETSQLPREFRLLRPHEVEDFLCMRRHYSRSTKRLTVRCS
jgi:hypothetical protein